MSPSAGLASLRLLAERTRPLALAGDQLFPVRPDLAAILPLGGLRKGTVTEVDSPALVFALLSTASAEGLWAALVGASSLGLAAAAECGIDLGRVAVVTTPPPDLAATVVAALIDAVAAVVVGPRVILRAADARRLTARARERGGVLVSLGGWPEAVDVRLRVERHRFGGLDGGHGHLRSWDAEVAVEGRGAAARPRLGVMALAGLDREKPAYSKCADSQRTDSQRADGQRAEGVEEHAVPFGRVG